MGCSNACSEGGCGKGSVANRKVLEEKPDMSCGNLGLEYAIYDGPSNKEWDPQMYDSADPQFTGRTTKVGVADASNIYGNKPKQSEHVVTTHRGYLYAKQSGVYTFTAPACDDSLRLWIGDKASSGWTAGNVDLFQEYVSAGGSPKQFTKPLEKGKYYPLRLVWGNYAGVGNFGFEIKAPDGSVVLDGRSGASDYLVSHSCDGSTAPKYPAWGPPPLSPSDACPALDGQTRVAGGNKYKFTCAGVIGSTPIKPVYPASLEQCALDCSATTGCTGFDYYRISTLLSVLLLLPVALLRSAISLFVPFLVLMESAAPTKFECHLKGDAQPVASKAPAITPTYLCGIIVP